MGKTKKLFSLTEDSLNKLETLHKNNPSYTQSEIINAIIQATPDDARLKVAVVSE